MSFDDQIKALRMLQDDSKVLEKQHEGIRTSLDEIKARVEKLAKKHNIGLDHDAIKKESQRILGNQEKAIPITEVSTTEIFEEANSRYRNNLNAFDILTDEDIAGTNERIRSYVHEFNKNYALDGWDYAIAGGCGLVAAMLDWFCVKAPPRHATLFTQKLDGIFNRGVQEAFNKILPPELSKKLSNLYHIGSADVSIAKNLFEAPPKILSPLNHRIRELSHDPVLGFIFGVLDMIRNTTTVVNNGVITSYSGRNTTPFNDNVFALLGRMFGHLCSDVNAPSGSGYRGMGLPAPFMGLLRLFDNIKIGDSTFDKQIEYMYVNGYDFRQFVTTSVPCMIMEIMMRAFWIVKQHYICNIQWGKALVDTMPIKINPRFRTMLTLGYGVICGCNYGKIHITNNILNLNYTAWMGLLWNSFHSLKWALYGKEMSKWSCIEQIEFKHLQDLVDKIDVLKNDVELLPV